MSTVLSGMLIVKSFAQITYLVADIYSNAIGFWSIDYLLTCQHDDDASNVYGAL